MKGKIVNVCWVTLLVILFGSSLSFAQTEANTILYQGKLTDDAGNPISSAVNVTFTIWSEITGGSNLYDTTASLTPNENGLFTIELGPFPASVSNGDKRYLGINVDGDGEMSPRQLITSAPTSLTAQTSVNAPGIVYGSAANSNSIYILADTGLSYAAATLYAPADGYAIITADAIAYINHTNGSFDNVIFSVSDVENDIGTGFQSTVVRIPREYPSCSDRILIPASITYTVPVTSGFHTFYLNAYESTGTGNDYVFKPIIHALYVPYYRGIIITKSSEQTGEVDNSLMLGTENLNQQQGK